MKTLVRNIRGLALPSYYPNAVETGPSLSAIMAVIPLRG